MAAWLHVTQHTPGMHLMDISPEMHGVRPYRRVSHSAATHTAHQATSTHTGLWPSQAHNQITQHNTLAPSRYRAWPQQLTAAADGQHTWPGHVVAPRRRLQTNKDIQARPVWVIGLACIGTLAKRAQPYIPHSCSNVLTVTVAVLPHQLSHAQHQLGTYSMTHPGTAAAKQTQCSLLAVLIAKSTCRLGPELSSAEPHGQSRVRSGSWGTNQPQPTKPPQAKPLARHGCGNTQQVLPVQIHGTWICDAHRAIDSPPSCTLPLRNPTLLRLPNRQTVPQLHSAHAVLGQIQ